MKISELLEVTIDKILDETLKKVNGHWALVSRKNPRKVLQYYQGSGHPSKAWVSKVERRVHSFSEDQDSTAQDSAMPRLISKSWRVTHMSSNLDSLANGFERRKLGISFARDGREKPYSSPTVQDAAGRRGIVKAKVYGSGLDYNTQSHKDFIERLYDKYNSDVLVIDALRNLGVDWVSGWNGIGHSNELHVLNPNKIHIVSITPID